MTFLYLVIFFVSVTTLDISYQIDKNHSYRHDSYAIARGIVEELKLKLELQPTASTTNQVMIREVREILFKMKLYYVNRKQFLFKIIVLDF